MVKIESMQEIMDRLTQQIIDLITQAQAPPIRLPMQPLIFTPYHPLIFEDNIFPTNLPSQEDNSIREGARFFKDFLLGNDQIDAESRNSILEMDPDIFHFALTRAIYIYVFGPKRGDAPPSFFKPLTTYHIHHLRHQYTEDQGEELIDKINNHEEFQIEMENNESREILNSLKIAASSELQGSVFSTRCWQVACEEYAQRHPQIDQGD